MLGERYGWSLATDPSDALLARSLAAAAARFPWIDAYRDRSVTELEMLYGDPSSPPPSFIPFVIVFCGSL